MMQVNIAHTMKDGYKRRKYFFFTAERRAQLNRSRSRTGLVGTGLLGRELST